MQAREGVCISEAIDPMKIVALENFPRYIATMLRLTAQMDRNCKSACLNIDPSIFDNRTAITALIRSGFIRPGYECESCISEKDITYHFFKQSNGDKTPN